mmetsp:Transcript_21500/g.38628  ORF Transcript_21500/g.38628 Transcript_21500/m.38628 type:complete len:205 (-) Transcript_21500:315-929(-)
MRWEGQGGLVARRACSAHPPLVCVISPRGAGETLGSRTGLRSARWRPAESRHPAPRAVPTCSSPDQHATTLRVFSTRDRRPSCATGEKCCSRRKRSAARQCPRSLRRPLGRRGACEWTTESRSARCRACTGSLWSCSPPAQTTRSSRWKYLCVPSPRAPPGTSSRAPPPRCELLPSSWQLRLRSRTRQGAPASAGRPGRSACMG